MIQHQGNLLKKYDDSRGPTSLQVELADETASELNEWITERTTCAIVDGEVRGVPQDV